MSIVWPEPYPDDFYYEDEDFYYEDWDEDETEDCD